mmetsp:Transcript_6808/g.17116  ORF Transcript_6808/g.17116 Transcript_6808/m.17116 type:complete len:263 (-) Transcript_6808:345-1133(-)
MLPSLLLFFCHLLIFSPPFQLFSRIRRCLFRSEVHPCLVPRCHLRDGRRYGGHHTTANSIFLLFPSPSSFSSFSFPPFLLLYLLLFVHSCSDTHFKKLKHHLQRRLHPTLCRTHIPPALLRYKVLLSVCIRCLPFVLYRSVHTFAWRRRGGLIPFLLFLPSLYTLFHTLFSLFFSPAFIMPSSLVCMQCWSCVTNAIYLFCTTPSLYSIHIRYERRRTNRVRVGCGHSFILPPLLSSSPPAVQLFLSHISPPPSLFSLPSSR